MHAHTRAHTHARTHTHAHTHTHKHTHTHTQVNVLLQDAEGKTCLHWCAESIYPEAAQCVQLICKKQRELVGARDSYQRTPLHSCAISGSLASLEVLLANGCDLMAVDGEEHTAAHWATGEHSWVNLFVGFLSI